MSSTFMIETPFMSSELKASKSSVCVAGGASSNTFTLVFFSCTRRLARGKSEKEAEQLVDTVDRERDDFIQKYFHVEWPDRPVYHTMINTVIGDAAVVQMILEVMKTVEARVAPAPIQEASM